MVYDPKPRTLIMRGVDALSRREYSRSELRRKLLRSCSEDESPDDVEEVKRHPFFAGVKWDEVLAKKTKPQWVPKLKGATDTGLFDKEFTDERAGVSFEDASMIPPEAVDSFQDFTCTADCALNDL